MIGLKGIKVQLSDTNEGVIIRTCVVGDACHAVIMDSEGTLRELPVDGLVVIESDRGTAISRVRLADIPVASVNEDSDEDVFNVPIAGGPVATS